MDKLKHLILLFVLINTQLTIAQEVITVDETLFIHINTTTLVSGETLFYKLYCIKTTDKTPSLVSKLAYVELIDNNNNSVFKDKIFLEDATGEGDYFIPTTLQTGNYKLIGYTSWMLNLPVSKMFQIDIKIINPYQTNETGFSTNKLSQKNSDSLTIAKNTIYQESSASQKRGIELNKKTYTNRERVTVKITPSIINNESGSYSLSVRKVDELPTVNQTTANEFTKVSATTNPDKLDAQKKIILPELRGEMISGRVVSVKESDNLQNITIALSLPGKSAAFKIVETDQTGHFIFNLNKAYYNPNIVMQVINEHTDNYTIELDKPNNPDYSKLSIQSDFTLSANLKQTLLDRSITNQIENAYYQRSKDSISTLNDSNPFYYPLAKEYILDDFTRFPTLKENLTEITKELYYKNKNNNYSLHVNDYTIYPQLPEPALVLIDGLLLQNVNELFNYNMKNIYKISVIAGTYYIGPRFFNGLISFTTTNNQFTSDIKENYILKPSTQRPSIKKQYNKIDYSDIKKNKRIPDYRNQLSWIPAADLNKEISFYTSDVTGTFEVTIEGFTETGKAISLKETFNVK
ncbi:hypothetical protein QO200_02560 [Flavobacterium sp. Arc3]|uniref:hypothetical protein n=1 Tax=Flavobacterium sp. Arc3 TaxID=3046686 RepID=UPI00352F9BAA